MGRTKLDLVGNRYGKLLVLGLDSEGVLGGRQYFHCRCDCGVEKSIRGSHLHQGRIKSCGCSQRSREKWEKATLKAQERCRKRLGAVIATGEKSCSRKTCSQVNPQPLTNFYWRYTQTKQGSYSPHCKTCHMDFRFKRAYGLDSAEKEKMIAQQGGKCANPSCDNPATDTDHNHATGRVRAILCNPCNKSEGFMRSDPDRIRGLADYIEHHNRIDSEKNVS